jgi:hypothetical protein
MDSMINGMLIVWYVLTAGSLVFIIWDLFTNTPTLGVMKLAWILIILYTGPVGLFIYLLSCRQPMPGTHDQFITSHWKQSIGSMMHCVAGDATGIILAAAVVYHFGFPNGIDLIIEYTSAFVVGLLVFQALFMRSMFGGDYLMAVRKTFFAETVSMNMVMIGMIPTMVILMSRFPDSDNPTTPLFWGIMSLACMAGMVTAYPINSWMVRQGIKHGMMTPPSETDRSTQVHMHGMSHDSGSGHDRQAHMNHGQQHPMNHHSHETAPQVPADHMTSGTQPSHMAGAMPMEHASSRESGHGHSMHHDGQGQHMNAHHMGTLPKGKAVVIVIATFACLAAAVWVTSFFAEIRL